MATIQSQGGFVFGVQGFEYGEIKPKNITFFTNGMATVWDHRGNPIQGWSGKSHQEVIEELRAAGHDWQNIEWVGFPQLPYDELMELKKVPVTPLEALSKIPDKELRAAAIKARREWDEVAAKELEEIEA